MRGWDPTRENYNVVQEKCATDVHRGPSHTSILGPGCDTTCSKQHYYEVVCAIFSGKDKGSLSAWRTPTQAMAAMRRKSIVQALLEFCIRHTSCFWGKLRILETVIRYNIRILCDVLENKQNKPGAMNIAHTQGRVHIAVGLCRGDAMTHTSDIVSEAVLQYVALAARFLNYFCEPPALTCAPKFLLCDF